ncbi:MAG: dihydrofolate reductase family protein [Streptomyces sp.]|nr:dihydrofolate reductase family protein [Streptomyces sp.]
MGEYAPPSPGPVLLLDGGLVDVVGRERRDLVDEYRLLTFPTVLGTGRRLFPGGGAPAELECLSVERVGGAVLACYRRAAR